MPMKKIMLGLFSLLALGVLSPSARAYNPVVVQQNMDVLRAQMPDKDHRFVGSSEPAQLFFRDEPVNVTLALTKGAQVGAVPGYGIEIQQFSTRDPSRTIKGVINFLGGGDEALIGLEGKPVEAPLKVVFTDKPEAQIIANGLPVPKLYGVYALILTHGAERRFLGTVARIPQPRVGGNIENTPLFGDGSFFDRVERYPMRAEIYGRLGVHGFRGENGWKENDQGVYDWGNDDALFAALSANNIQEMVTLGAQSWNLLPFKEPTPAAGWTPQTGGYSGTGDWNVAPELYPRYGKWVTAFCQRYWKGGKGAIWALENFNEPWEGGGISGWARDTIQYRAIQKVIAESAHGVSPDIKIAAASSIMNTEDKLYPDGSREFDKYIDIFTDHYVSPQMCYGPMVAKAHGKVSQESETWMADAEYKLPLVAAPFMASGQLRLAPWQPGEIFDTLPGNDDPYFIPGPVVTATAAFNYFTTGKTFEKIVFPNHLPWVFQYGKDTDKDTLLIVFGQLTPAGEDPKNTLWAQVEAGPTGTMTIDNHDGLLQFYDLAGNSVYQGQKTVKLPLTLLPTYITSVKGPVVAAARLNTAHIDGKRPVEILPQDFTMPLSDPNATLSVTLHNCLNRAITGTLTATPPAGLALKTAALPITIPAGATQALAFGVASAPTDGGNAFPFTFHFASAAGNADYAETMIDTSISKRTITVDGNLDDWKDIPGTVVVAKLKTVDVGELARQPWLNLKTTQPNASFAEVKTAWDENNFYISAQVNEANPQMDKPRQEGLDPNSFFHSAADDTVSPYKEWLQKHPGRSFSEVPYIYRKPSIPALAYAGDRLHFAFDVTPGFHDMIPDTDRVPYGFHAVPDTDYEYSAYLCADGKGELWRMLAPGVPRIHDFPHQPRGARTTGLVPGAKYVVRQDGNVRIYEIAIPKSELADLNLTPGTTFGFTFRVGMADGHNMDFGLDKAVTKTNGLTLHPYWEPKPSCTVQWKLGN